MTTRPAAAAVATVTALAGLAAGPLAAAAARPAAAQSPGTTIAVEPVRAVPDQLLTATGESDCELMHVALSYRDHAGAKRYGGADGDATWDPARNRYRYAIRIRVPRDTSPKYDGVVQAQTACGDAEEGFPPSREVVLPIDPAPARLTVTPAILRPGNRVTVSGGCLGGTRATLPVRVSWPNGGGTYRASVTDGTFRVSVRVPSSAAGGSGRVSVAAEAGCPGTALPAAAEFVVRARRGTAAPGPSVSPSPSISASPTDAPAALVPSPSPSVRVARRAGTPGPGTLLVALLLLGGLLAVAIGTATALTWRRDRRTGEPA